MDQLRFSTCLVIVTGLALGLCGGRDSWAGKMEVGKTTPVEVNAEQEASPVEFQIVIELDRKIHFLTPQGEDVALLAGNYHVEAAGSWLKLLPEGEVRSAMILIKATQGSHEEKLTEPIVRAEPDETNPDIFHLAVLRPDGTGLETVGSSSGVRTRGSRLTFLKRPALKSSPKRPAPQALQLPERDPAIEREIIRLQTLMRQGPQAVPDKQTAFSEQSQQREQALVQDLLELRKLLGQ